MPQSLILLSTTPQIMARSAILSRREQLLAFLHVAAAVMSVSKNLRLMRRHAAGDRFAWVSSQSASYASRGDETPLQPSGLPDARASRLLRNNHCARRGRRGGEGSKVNPRGPFAVSAPGAGGGDGKRRVPVSTGQILITLCER